MTWNVVIFTKEDKVEAVPKNWCIKTSSECFWPPHSFKTEKIYKLIESKADTDTNWKVYPVKLLGTYDDFQIAQQKARKATISSDISSTNEEAIVNKKRKRKENPKFHYSGSESSEDSDDNIYPKKSVLQSMFPQEKGMKKSKTIKRFRSKSFSPERPSKRQNSDEYLNRRTSVEFGDSNTDNQRPGTSSSILSQDFLNPSAETSSGSSFISHARKSVAVEGNQMILEKSSSDVLSDNEFKKVVVGELTLLNLKVNAVSENVTAILSLMRHNENTGTTEPDLLKKIRILNNKLPLKSNEELKELEVWLTEENNYNLMVTELRRMGGQSLPQAVRKILYRLLSNEVAALYSWEGAKQKAALKNLLLAKCLLDAVKIQYPGSVDTEITAVIKIWLVKAKERLTRKPHDVQSQETILTQDIN